MDSDDKAIKLGPELPMLLRDLLHSRFQKVFLLQGHVCIELIVDELVRLIFLGGLVMFA